MNDVALGAHRIKLSLNKQTMLQWPACVYRCSAPVPETGRSSHVRCSRIGCTWRPRWCSVWAAWQTMSGFFRVFLITNDFLAERGECCGRLRALFSLVDDLSLQHAWAAKIWNWVENNSMLGLFALDLRTSTRPATFSLDSTGRTEFGMVKALPCRSSVEEHKLSGWMGYISESIHKLLPYKGQCCVYLRHRAAFAIRVSAFSGWPLPLKSIAILNVFLSKESSFNLLTHLSPSRSLSPSDINLFSSLFLHSPLPSFPIYFLHLVIHLFISVLILRNRSLLVLSILKFFCLFYFVSLMSWDMKCLQLLWFCSLSASISKSEMNSILLPHSLNNSL